ncbi:YdiJ protein [Candidatus Pantoea carbekii]|uniref:D-2-hydroxyglutarate dehydrogenase n=1 Tax=Candidatus Pantoea carbekii TaxID=1235990 RepID=U3U9P9_9GAMM|nr:YdiJ protein [Candidatus Pantoea carbekii]
MIPRISHIPNIVKIAITFLELLKKKGFSGDISIGYADRLALSTDNSIYQLLPDAILFPRSTADIVLVAKLANDSKFSSLVFTARGGGTGTNGQSLNRGIIIDTSRYMNHILKINVEERWVRVETGVVKDQLNIWLKPYGLFFCPELSTSNRATLGGMINTDASGQGSLIYGKTSDHVKALQIVLLSGHIMETYAMPSILAEKIGSIPNDEGRIYQQVLKICRSNRTLILKNFPKLKRFLTGYDLEHVFSNDMQTFDMTRLLCGSEGTLAFITEAKLNIIPIPRVRRLVNIKYNCFDSALRNTSLILSTKASSIETIDSKILSLASADICWYSLKNIIQQVCDKDMSALNIVEFTGNNAKKIEKKVNTLCNHLDKLIAIQQHGIIAYQLCNDTNIIEHIYNMRKKAVGLLGNIQGDSKPIPFVEDTVVPPERLADYIADFRKLLDTYGLNYGMFGHVDVGVLHVRPELDICDPTQEQLVKKISDEVVKLTSNYGGLLWGEHGKGFRSQYSPIFFGATLFKELRRIKSAFDPYNRMNPGKICTPLGNNKAIIQVDAEKRGTYDRQIPIFIRNEWHKILECNGNGLCFNLDVHTIMCPSMKITRNRVLSPKGRATLIREWLRLLSNKNINLSKLEKHFDKKSIKLLIFIKKMRNSLFASLGQYDFSHEIKEAMFSCLACKACSTQCPVKIDISNFRSRFLQLYYMRYLRPISDYLVANLEYYIPIVANVPRLFNFFLNRSLVRNVSQRYIGMVDLPILSYPTLKQQLRNHKNIFLTLKQIQSIQKTQYNSYILIVQDVFTSYYEASLVYDFIILIQKLGYRAVILPFLANGKTEHVKGFLKRFMDTAKNTAEFLNSIAELDIAMVGIDPAMVLCYRDEYHSILKSNRGNFNVLMVDEWLSQIINRDRDTTKHRIKKTWYLFSHCTESAISPDSSMRWKNIFAYFGLKLESVNIGCCGMAGTYGHEKKNLKNSLGIYELSWSSKLQDLPIEYCLATGFSCRNQIKRIHGKIIHHPIQVLVNLMK